MEKFMADLKQKMNQAVKKSGELVELTKVKIAIGDTKNAIDANFKALGELAYLATKGDDMPADEAEILVGKIDSLKVELAELESKAADLSSKKICPACEKTSPQEASFCQACGNPFPPVE